MDMKGRDNGQDKDMSQEESAHLFDHNIVALIAIFYIANESLLIPDI